MLLAERSKSNCVASVRHCNVHASALDDDSCCSLHLWWALDISQPDQDASKALPIVVPFEPASVTFVKGRPSCAVQGWGGVDPCIAPALQYVG